MIEARTARFERYVAIGDSSTEGLEDPDGRGGYRGWANRLAEHIADAQGSVLYANLAVRGRHTRQILEGQLEPALAMRPDVATLFAGTNDAVSRRFDATAVGSDIENMQRRLVEGGATVLTFTLPDLTPVMPLGRLVAPRVQQLNDMLRQVSESTGTILVDFAAHPMASDRRIWCDDGFHANALGHARIAAALADALGLPGADDAWSRSLPTEVPKSRARRVAGEVGWVGRFFLPWLWRHLQGRSSGDGLSAKRPKLLEVSSHGARR